MNRDIFLPCTCGKIHKLTDPGKNIRLVCRISGGPLVYECHLGEEYRLRGERKDYILDQDRVEIGRKATDGILVNNPTLSRRHARFISTGQGYAVEDLGSSNGTFVNENKLQPNQPHQLIPGDLIRLGKLRLRFIAPEQLALDETCAFNMSKGGDVSPRIKGESANDVHSVKSAAADELNDIQDDLVGKEVGVYKIHSLLSQGGMGRIYRATHLSLDRECVLKTIRPEMSDSDEIMARFLREISLGAKVWHPNVIAFYDAGQTDEFWYLAMEYFSGKNLWEIFSGNPAHPEDVISIGTQAASALSAAHQEGVIHRDIKPRNILRDHAGVVKIVDFGISKVRQDPQYSTLTLNGAIVGTPAYMAPEQISSPAEVDHRIDIYALGAVLYFALAGRPPYVGRNAGQVLRQVGKSVPRPSQLRRGIPPKLEGAVIKAMHPEPGKRFPTADELKETLEGIR